MSKVFVLFFITINLYAVSFSTLKNNESMVKYMEYVVDHNDTYDFQKIKQLKDWQPLPRSNLGYMKYPVWTKTVVHNDTDKRISFFFKNPRPGMDIIDTYIIEDNGKLKTLELGDMVPFTHRQIMHNFSVLHLRMKPGETSTIYAKLTSIGPTEAGWIYNTFRGLLHFTIADMFWWGILTGAVLALIIYYLTLYYAIRFSFILAYISMGFWSLLFQLLLHGFFRFEAFGIPLDVLNILNWFAINLMMLSMLSFATLFFDMRRTMPRIHIVFLGISLLTAIGTIFFSPLGDPSLGNTLVIYATLLWYGILLFTGIWSIRLKLIGAWYYMLGQGIFSATIWLQNLSFAGVVDTGSLFSYLIVPAGTLIDLIFLSLAIGSFIKKIKHDKQKLQLHSLSQSKFDTIGKNFAAALHQWKTPVARLGTNICEIESYLRFGNQKKLNQNITPCVSKMYESINELEKILDDFGSLFKTETQKQHFKAQDLIKEIIDFLDSRIQKHAITVNITPAQELILFSHKSPLRHIYLTMLDNAIDILIERQVKNPRIDINFSIEKNNFTTTIEDNGGGIKQKPIESVFEAFESRKIENKDNYGLGLMIAKMITEDKLRGTLEAHNRSQGACFMIKINLAI